MNNKMATTDIHQQSKKQTKQGRKTETESWIWGWEGQAVEGLSKKEKGLMDMDNSVI